MKLSIRIIFILCAMLLISAAQNAAAADGDKTVTVNILSKQIRLLQEGTLSSINIDAPPDAIIRVESSTISSAIKLPLQIVKKGQALKIISVDRQEFSGNFIMRIESGLKDGECTASFGTEKRVYPLPLIIKGNGSDWKIITEEKIGRYAAEVSRSEYGNLKENQQEARAALMMMIMARSAQVKKHPFHEGHDFCDLAHCQVYYGHTKEINHSELPWLIDAAKVNLLPFNANCGGLILGNSVFGKGQASGEELKDWIKTEKNHLCSLPGSAWERTLTPEEIITVVWGQDAFSPRKSFSLKYEKIGLPLEINYGGIIYNLAPEDFRLKINRIYGWNFICSNNYKISIRSRGGNKAFVFNGHGLGHGAGLCQQGALKLAELGYSRYEILYHYFPEINFYQNPAAEKFYHPDFSFVVFSLATGRPIDGSHGNIVARKIPAGSLFKLVVALYLASEDSDRMNNHHFFCGNSPDENMPAKCWHPAGHGDVDFSAALAHSCNLYFSSLYRHLPKDNFGNYWKKLNRELMWDNTLPALKTDKEFARLLAGLDFSVKLSVPELMQLAMILSPLQTHLAEVEKIKATIPQKNREIIMAALREAVVTGSASPEGRSAPVAKRNNITADQTGLTIWGKTSTVIDGTNKSLSYGIFLGGYRDTGIIAIKRNSNGHLTAREAIKILLSYAD